MRLSTASTHVCRSRPKNICLIVVLIFLIFLSIPILHLKQDSITKLIQKWLNVATNHALSSTYVNATNQASLRIYSILSARAVLMEKDIPTVPCLSADRKHIVLSATASRIRFGQSITFIVVHYLDVPISLPRNTTFFPTPASTSSVSIMYDDGSIMSCYGHDFGGGSERYSSFTCPILEHADRKLWLKKEAILVYLVSMINKDKPEFILKAFVNVPEDGWKNKSDGEEQMTLCTSPLRNMHRYLPEWIEFHLLVGFRKFVIYLTEDGSGQTKKIVDTYAKTYPNLVDIVPWNFAKLSIKDKLRTRIFQVEAIHDCLTRYGDQSEWMGSIDLDEYIVPLKPYDTVKSFLRNYVGNSAIGSIELLSLFYCPAYDEKYSRHEQNTSRTLFERFPFRAPTFLKGGRQKYLYRPRFVFNLGIHSQFTGFHKLQSENISIRLAHYMSMSRHRRLGKCGPNEIVYDTYMIDTFAQPVRQAVETKFPDRYSK